MRTVRIGNTCVTALDEPGQGGACHNYLIDPSNISAYLPNRKFGEVHFQNGPINEVGVNGCQHEDLIAIVIDRLRSFQAGPFACRENDLALTKLEEALHWLNHRTAEREARGVEGINVK